MKCPVCQETLTMTERQGVEIDFCPKCRGVWLDRGELDKILERATADMARDAVPPPQPPPAYPSHDPRYRHDRRDDDYYRYGKKKKSIWHELFD